MPVNLSKLYISIVTKLDAERSNILDGDFETESPKPALYIIFLHSAFEKFLSIAFGELIKYKDIDSDAKENLQGRIGNFSLKDDFPLFCSLFLPNIYVKSEIRQFLVNKRNRYAHNIIDKNGEYIFKSEAKYYLSNNQIDDFIEYSKKTMKDVMDGIEAILSPTIA